ncbi:protein AMBP-like [Folsomia candida]|uniref:protein AMBP-like n=1 Tax=Folsomia candida TaxID=158441 RepID=UPI0016052D9A|nr:protein AMBP-like [Folsomia candida]
MYYFDSTKEKCTSFTYLGCAGNQNKFEASDDCIDSCQTPWFIKKNKEEDKKNPGGEEPHKKSDCSLPYEAGPCKALITMWYYNSAQAACEVFGYGGCNGNGNKFDSRLECETFCGDNPEVKKKSS